MSKVLIIGAGIAGLSAGVYGQLNGLETEIIEMHGVAGGECTAWKRNGYTIDGCIHWLMGSKKGLPLNDVWRTTGALDDSIEIVNHEIFSRFLLDGRTLNLYTNIDKLEKELLSLSPDDKEPIGELCGAVRKLANMVMPVDKPFDMMGMMDGLKSLSMIPKASLAAKYGKISLREYASRFKDPLIRFAILSFMPEEYDAASFILTLASLNDGDSGYPLGGSLPFAQRMEKRYRELGGNIRYRSRAESVLVENGKAKGVRLSDGTELFCDFVLSTADGYETLYHLLNGQYLTPYYKERYENWSKYPVQVSSYVSFGVDSTLCDLHCSTVFKPQKPVDGGNRLNVQLGLRHFGYDPSMAPQGKSVVTCILYSDFDHWKKLSADREAYRKEKERLAKDVLAAFEEILPGISEKVEMTDVATPVTYERYCNAHRGSWMSWITVAGDTMMRYMSGELPGLENFYLSGQWTMPPGGLPGAVMTGKFSIYRLCRKLGIKPIA